MKSIEVEKNVVLNGVVTNKYAKGENIYPTIEVFISDQSIVKKSLHAEKSGLYDYIEIGDSISKSENSLLYKIIRNDSVRTFKYTMFCNEDN